MSKDYTGLAATAKALITNAGQTLTFRRETNVVDPATGESTVPERVTWEMSCVVLPASGGVVEAFDDRLREDMVRGHIRSVIAAAMGSSYAPQANDLCEYEDQVWTVLGCTPLKPAGLALVYNLSIRR